MLVPQFSCFVLLVPLSVFLPIFRAFSPVHLWGLLSPPLHLIPGSSHALNEAHVILMSISAGFDLSYQLSNRLSWKIMNSSFDSLRLSRCITPPLCLLLHLLFHISSHCFFHSSFPLLHPPTPQSLHPEREEVLMTLMVSFKNTFTLRASNAAEFLA